MAAKTVSSGLLVASLRDYDRIVQERPISTQPQVTQGAEGRRISFQVWDWAADGKCYQLNHFTVKQAGDSWETRCGVTHLRAWQRDEVTRLLQKSNLTDIRWHRPEESGFYQPIVTARKV